MKTMPMNGDSSHERLIPQSVVEQAILEALMKSKGAFREWRSGMHGHLRTNMFAINRARGWTLDGKLCVYFASTEDDLALWASAEEMAHVDAYLWLEALYEFQEAIDSPDGLYLDVHWEVPAQPGVAKGQTYIINEDNPGADNPSWSMVAESEIAPPKLSPDRPF